MQNYQTKEVLSKSLPDLETFWNFLEPLENVRAGLPYPVISLETHELLIKEYSVLSKKLRNSLSFPCLRQSSSCISRSTNDEDSLPAEYTEVSPHWYHHSQQEPESLWVPFSLWDSFHLEEAFQKDVSVVVPTDGGRYDVNLVTKLRHAVYWEEEPFPVIRATWFYKGPYDHDYVPYEEIMAGKIETAYRQAVLTDTWHTRLEFANGDIFLLNGPTLFVHQSFSSMGVEVEGEDYLLYNVRRGVGELEDIADGEVEAVSHLTFMVHGIGSVYDMKLRKLVPCVNDFRSLMADMGQQCGGKSAEKRRVEVIPVSWHHHLHGEKTGLDELLDTITLESIPKIRHITKDTILDVLYYTSPKYSKLILEIVQSELNRLYKVFLHRNPLFRGKVSLIGHSLGSIILFDLLQCQGACQTPVEEIPIGLMTQFGLPVELHDNVKLLLKNLKPPNSGALQLDFVPENLFALGSPIGLFLAARGVDSLGEDFTLPNCPHVFNIFHPFDPIAFRIEPLINVKYKNIRPVMLPHHKGRKRLHLEFKEAVQKFSGELKARIFETIKVTAESFSIFTFFQSAFAKFYQDSTELSPQTTSDDDKSSVESENLTDGIGLLNSGKRIDYVLQESPLETVNEYIFALSSHLCYWESEDTVLFIVNHLFGTNCSEFTRKKAKPSP